MKASFYRFLFGQKLSVLDKNEPLWIKVGFSDKFVDKSKPGSKLSKAETEISGQIWHKLKITLKFLL